MNRLIKSACPALFFTEMTSNSIGFFIYLSPAEVNKKMKRKMKFKEYVKEYIKNELKIDIVRFLILLLMWIFVIFVIELGSGII